MEEKRKSIFDVKLEGAGGEELKRIARVIKDSAVESALAVIEDSRTLAVVGGIGLMQGLKYKGSFKLGVKSGLATLGVMVGISVINGLVEDKDKIKGV